ncbi:ABC transporter [Frankia sp. AgB1.9]|uniref:ABC transporter n=1 Tax=unclassified Frankia TaxID=2632575 RepID=UPI001933B97D|nr:MULTISPECIES: ABC transporter [unclassified Frankia]MBL7486570.1 ABC transporter [Frankia sp. AgW1.1]MBL7553143.1 ABC transporter [Frankia sp. AgB1.9]MBL7618277.1 ABC transporter [Frankia sp. AgB1.8]
MTPQADALPVVERDALGATRPARNGRSAQDGRPARDGRLVAIGRSYRSEARKLRRPGTFLAMGGLAALAVLSSVLSFALAKNGTLGAGRMPEVSVPTLQALAAPGGILLGFRVGSTFTGLLLMVLCAATMATEYGQGTIRMIFMREPRRLSWLAGRMGAVLSLLAVALVGAFVLSAATAVLMAQIRGVSTGQWWTAVALREAGRNYLNVLVATTFFAVTGTALGLLIRSTTAAVLIGVAWMFPLEHIIQQAWLNGVKWLPGLVFSDIGTGGNLISGYRGPLLLGTAYAVAFAAIAAASLARRDVTA